MSGFIKVTPEQLGALSARVDRGAGSIEGELSAMQGALAPLRADWAGHASSNFEALWDQWNRSARELHQALAGISRLLGQAGNRYREVEQANAASLGAM